MTQTDLQINSAAISDKGLSDKRPQNEDSYLELRDSGFFAVADGVGGAQAGEVASTMAMEILGEAFINLQEGGDAEERMKAAVEQANSAIFQMSNDLPQLSTMATTVVGLHLSNNIATIGHVGDSRLYRVDKEGNLYQETHDHSVVEEEVRAGRMTPAQAATHPSRNVISRALGAEGTVEVDLKTIMFDAGTTFLVCSDGVTRHISDDELRELLFSELDTFAICQKIKDLCYERGAEDNLTAVVVKALNKVTSDFPDASEVLEEETISTANPLLVDSSILTDSSAKTKKLPAEESFRVENDEPTLETKREISSQKPQVSIPEEPATTASLSILPSDSSTKSESDLEGKPRSIRDEKSYRVDENSTTGVLRKFFYVLPWVLLAGTFSLLAYMFLSQYFSSKPNENAEQLKTQTANLVLTSFEQNRRNVDADPAKYIANSASPKDAIDNYLLGRAHFLQKNYSDAKVHLLNAKSMLSDGVSLTNLKVLENDIPMMMAIIDNPAAQKGFENQVNTAQMNNSNSANK